MTFALDHGENGRRSCQGLGSPLHGWIGMLQKHYHLWAVVLKLWALASWGAVETSQGTMLHADHHRWLGVHTGGGGEGCQHCCRKHGPSARQPGQAPLPSVASFICCGNQEAEDEARPGMEAKGQKESYLLVCLLRGCKEPQAPQGEKTPWWRQCRRCLKKGDQVGSAAVPELGMNAFIAHM